MEYRIKELSGVFTIHVKKYRTKGILWWKNRTYVLHLCNDNGEICRTWPVDESPCVTFQSLAAAKKRIELFRNPPKPIYHSCD